MAESNGVYKINDRFDKLDKEMLDMKDDLSGAIRELTEAVRTLNIHFSTFINVAQTAIPIKAVFWMFFILVLTIGGIEGVKHLPKFLGVM